MRTLLTAVLILLPCGAAAASERNDPLAFEPNRGQTGAAVRYLARTTGVVAFFTDTEVVLAGKHAPLRLQMAGGDPAAQWSAEPANGRTTNYLVGRDSSKWVRDVPQYSRLLRLGVYPGVDVAFYGNTGRLEYDFLLAPYASPAAIRLRIAGTQRLRLLPDGSLDMDTAEGSVRQAKPTIYQVRADGERVAIDGHFRLIGSDTVGFALGPYDPALPLAIDPVLVSFSYIGGIADDRIVAAASSSEFAGVTDSVDFPGATVGRRNGDDVVVNTGVAVYVIGGTGNDEVTAASFSPYSGIMVVGYTDSQDLPTNLSRLQYVTYPTVWQSDYAGGASDGFVLWIGAYNGSYYGAPIYLSYLGTAGDDKVTAVTAYGSGYAIAGSTTGTGLPGPFSNAPAGGTDGFVMLLNGFGSSVTPSISPAAYLGGSGDDTPYGIGYYNGFFYVTGDTSSTDFPLLNPLFPARRGGTDAFLTELKISSAAFQIAGSTLLGGSQTDRGVALTFNSSGNLLLAGTTSSPDLPVTANAVQSTYGGGASDVFVAQFLPDLSQLVSLTYYGGSGAEEPTSIATDYFGSLYVAGWTASADFPAQNALQPAYGGGPDDGFLLHFDTDGSLYEATYFGGNGSDRIYGLYANNDFTVWIAGQTTSTNLTGPSGTGGALYGPSDGFVAQIGAPLLGAYACSGGNGLRAGCRAEVGSLNGSSTAPLTLTSSDPSRVLIAPDSQSAGQTTVTIGLLDGYNSDYRPFYVDCLADSGGADVQLTAPGYPTRIIHVSCYPVQLLVNTVGAVSNSQAVVTVSLWTANLQFSAYLYAVNPATGAELASLLPLPGQPPIAVSIASSNPAAGSVNPSFTLTGTSSGSFVFHPTAIGDTVLSFTSPQVGIANSIRVSVVSPISAPALSIPVGFQTVFGTYSGTAPTATSVTATSGDPTSLVFSLDPQQPGTASVTGILGSDTIYAQALASAGDIPVTLTVAGLPPVTGPVHLAPPELYCYGCAASLSLGLMAETSVSPYIKASGGAQVSLSRNPGLDPVTIGLTSSNTAVATVLPASFTITPGPPAYYPGTFAVNGAGTGSATLSMQASGGIAVDPGAASFSVNVQKHALKMAGIDVGKDLAGLMSLAFPAVSSAAVTVTVADPTLALLSLTNTDSGQAQIKYNVVSNAGLGFYVQGLASSGQTQVTATVDQYGSITATVRLGPAGLIWSTDSVSAQLYGSSQPSVLVEMAVLDSTTMLPVGVEPPRYGVTASAQLQSSDASIVTVPASLSFSSTSSATVSLSLKGVGTASVSIIQPTGLSMPAIRENLKVTVQTPSLSISGFPIGKDTQLPVTYAAPNGGVAPSVTLTSSDPTKLVLSTDPSTPGSVSVTVTGSQQVMAQALDSQGTAQITVSAAGYNSATATYSLKGLGVGITSNSENNGAVATTTQSPVTSVPLNLYLVDASTGAVTSPSYQTAYRPGVTAPSVTVTSSNPAAGQVLQSPARLNPPGSGSTATVSFMPAAAGDTSVAVVQPAGYLAPAGYSSILFHVTVPTFAGASLLMGKDTFISLSPGLQSTVAAPTVNVNVTITSSDPTRVVLSAAADTNTAASVVKVLVAGQLYVNQFYVHALDSSGTVTLKVSAPGYLDAFYTVTLTALRFGLSSGYIPPPVRAVIQKGPQTYGIVFSLAPVSGVSASYYSPAIRPGVNFNLTVATSDPTVLAVDNPTVAIAAGAGSASVVARPVAVGLCALTLTAPAGYATDPAANPLIVSVEGAKLSINATSTLGRDLQSSLNITSEAAFTGSTPLTIYSTDPSRLLVSADSATPGAASVTILGSSGTTAATAWVQSLSDSGTATLVASADGCQPATTTVAFAPSAAVFGSSNTSQNLYTNSAVQTLGVTLAYLDPVTLNSYNYGFTARPGAILTAAIASSNSSVVALDQSLLTFTGTNSVTVKAQPVGSGSALVTLSPLPGGFTASTGTEIVYNVTEPDLTVADLTIGRDLQAAVQLRLASRIPAPVSDLTLNIETYSTFNVALSTDPAVAGSAQSIPVVIPAGQHLSKPFYVQGLSPGTTSLYAFGGGFNSSTSNVTVTATGFVFQEAIQASTLYLAPGASTNLTVVPVALPVGTPAPAGMTLRPGASPIALTVAHTGSALTVSPSSVTLHPGDASAIIGVIGAALGSGTVSLSGPAAYQYPAQSSVTIVVQNLGSVSVNANVFGAYFSINGQRNYTSSAHPWSQSEPPGSYTVTFESIYGYTAPGGQTLALSAGGSLTFTGNYVTTPVGLVCAVTGDPMVSVADIKEMIREALGTTAAAHDLSQDKTVGPVDVQLVVNAVLALGCYTGQPAVAAVAQLPL